MRFGPARVMLAEDDRDQREALAELLEAAGHEVVRVEDGEQVRSFVESAFEQDRPARRVHVLVTDLQMPKLSGLDVLEYMDEVGVQLPTVLITGFGSSTEFAAARRLGVRAVLEKPIDPGSLERILDEILQEEDEGRPVH